MGQQVGIFLAQFLNQPHLDQRLVGDTLPLGNLLNGLQMVHPQAQPDCFALGTFSGADNLDVLLDLLQVIHIGCRVVAVKPLSGFRIVIK